MGAAVALGTVPLLRDPPVALLDDQVVRVLDVCADVDDPPVHLVDLDAVLDAVPGPLTYMIR